MNERSQSQAEYTVMGLGNHPNAVKIGSQTASADGPVTHIQLPGKFDTVITGLGVYYPDGTPTQRVGIIPDLFIKPSIIDAKNGVDSVLNAALNCNNIANNNWPTDPKPKSALFWDPKHSGTGIDIAEIGNRYTVIPYKYREDGSPVWYLGVAETEDGSVNLLEESMNEFRFDPDIGITALNSDTTMSFDFKRGPQEILCATRAQENKSYPSHMTWTLDEEVTKLCEEEFIFASGEPEKDFTGLWWGGGTENGWGVSINTQGKQIVTSVYFYDENGKALWLLGSANFDTNNPTTINLKKFTHCPSCSNNQYPSQDVATLTLSLKQKTADFNDDNWLSLEFGDSIWNRDQMPIKIFSNLQE